MRKKKEHLRNNHKKGDNFNNPSWPVIQFLAPAAAGTSVTMYHS